ncbi:hypothetical protein B566_EDAN011428 [Ephemera danica]|nr:hypothetical protein B566_EDAN011428 [Ephemera danica]
MSNNLPETMCSTMLPVVRRLELRDEDEEEDDENYPPPSLPSNFKRGQSRVYHASEWREHDWTVILPPRTTKSSPPEQDWGLLLSAPGGPPSHRSQDSGFSDSESEASPQQLLEFKPLPVSHGDELPTASSPLPGPPPRCSTPKLRRSPACSRSSVPRLSPPGATLGGPLSLLLAVRPGEVCRDPVQRWLQESRARTDPECMTTLQGKAIASRLGQACSSRVAGARDAVRALQQRAHVISAEFAKLCQQMERDRLDKVPPLAQSLVGHVGEFVRGYRTHHARCANDEHPEKHEAASRLAKDEGALVSACARLQASCSEDKDEPSRDELASLVATLGHAFTRLVDRVLSHEIKSLVCVLEQPSPAELELRAALAGLSALGQEGAHLSRLVARCGGVRALLALCLDARATQVRVAALRALAIVCSVVEGVRQLDQSGGVEILADVLIEPCRPESERAEAASVLAQATAPGLEGRLQLESLPEHLESLVPALARLAGDAKSTETLLLALAALTNLSFLEPRRCVAALVQCEAAERILTAVRRAEHASSVLFVHEQAATLIANMAAIPEARNHLAEGGRAVVALLCFLQVRSSPLQRAAEISAAERVQQKSAIALSRLCSTATVAQQVVDLQGAERIVRLCKDERERNHSDGVLVACLSALRKISSHCGAKVIESLGAQELVEPRLLDSFLLYSSRQESYV